MNPHQTSNEPTISGRAFWILFNGIANIYWVLTLCQVLAIAFLFKLQKPHEEAEAWVVQGHEVDTGVPTIGTLGLELLTIVSYCFPYRSFNKLMS